MLLKIVKESNGKRPKVREKNPTSFQKLRKKIQKAEMIVFQHGIDEKLYLQENRSTGRKTFV